MVVAEARGKPALEYRLGHEACDVGWVPFRQRIGFGKTPKNFGEPPAAVFGVHPRRPRVANPACRYPCPESGNCNVFAGILLPLRFRVEQAQRLDFLDKRRFGPCVEARGMGGYDRTGLGLAENAE